MEQIQSERPGRKFLALALLPFLGYSLVMLAGRFSPFGSSSILYSDMYHQYYPFFVEFWRGAPGPVARWSITGIWAWGWTTWGSLPTILPLP